MFEKYTETARRVIFFARYEASQYGASYIEAPHLLLGLLREGQDVFNAIMEPASGGASQLAAALRAMQPKAEQEVSTSVDLPLSHACNKALAHAAREAANLSSPLIDIPHLLLGLLLVMQDENSAEFSELQSRGVTVDAVRRYPGRSRPEAAAAGKEALKNLMDRAELTKLIGRLPQPRLAAANRLLEGLCAPHFAVSGVDAEGPFSYAFGLDPNPHTQ
jgi:ATP-dependent Clp protease ATP-binding subunit ClpC